MGVYAKKVPPENLTMPSCNTLPAAHPSVRTSPVTRSTAIDQICVTDENGKATAARSTPLEASTHASVCASKLASTHTAYNMNRAASNAVGPRKAALSQTSPSAAESGRSAADSRPRDASSEDSLTRRHGWSLALGARPTKPPSSVAEAAEKTGDSPADTARTAGEDGSPLASSEPLAEKREKEPGELTSEPCTVEKSSSCCPKEAEGSTAPA